MPRCTATKADGTPCERIVGAAQHYCYSHDKARAPERSANASKAAKAKASTELGEVKRQLRTIADDVLSGRLDKGKASVSAQVLGVYTRVVEAERRLRETDELEARLDALEQDAEARRGQWGA